MLQDLQGLPLTYILCMRNKISAESSVFNFTDNVMHKETLLYQVLLMPEKFISVLSGIFDARNKGDEEV